MNLPNTPPKGTSDWFPDEYAIRDYIFQTWKRVNLAFGYQQYLTPIIESADIYKAKSGEDIGGKELMTMTDRAGRELAIRPEMTPSVTRMITRQYNALPKPIRYFSIANYLRNERPQRGRNREFWQLNTDVFGSNSIQADIEILSIALEIMIAFKAPANSFTLFLNHRQLIDAILEPITNLKPETKTSVIRMLDKYQKITPEAFTKSLKELSITDEIISYLQQFMESKSAIQLIKQFPQLEQNPGYQQIIQITDHLSQRGYADWITFDPTIIRGFDYYDGMVFEVFDKHPDNNRSLFGGGRYNGLAELFGKQPIPAVGFAPGDETTKLFLQNWNLLPNNLTPAPHIYIPLIIENKYFQIINKCATQLRENSFSVETGLEPQTITSALNYANKRHIAYTLLLGTQERDTNTITLKNMQTGNQQTIPQDQLIHQLEKLLKS